MRGYAKRSSRVPHEVQQEIKIYLLGMVAGALLMLLLVWATIS